MLTPGEYTLGRCIECDSCFTGEVLQLAFFNLFLPQSLPFPSENDSEATA